MDSLKEQIINYILKFISEREREVRTSDLLEVVMSQFGSELKDNCSDNPFADEMFAESVIHETYRLYGLTFTEKDGKLIGLNKEGRKAASHPKGVLGFLDDKEKEKKLLEIRSRVQFWAEIIATVVAAVGLFVDFMTPNTIWSNNLVYFACGFMICLIAARLFRFVSVKMRK